MHSELAGLINSSVNGANATVAKGDAGDEAITVESAKLLEVAKFLKSNSKYSFKVLECITATDFKEYIEVAYIVATFDPANNHEVIIKAKLDRTSPEIESVCSLWKSANFLERECYDMMGIIFRNHPDFRRILCPEDWTGYPLRKDYVVQEVYNGMIVNPEMKMNIPDREFAEKQKAANRAANAAAATSTDTPAQ